jgi:hypothetical protein
MAVQTAARVVSLTFFTYTIVIPGKLAQLVRPGIQEFKCF